MKLGMYCVYDKLTGYMVPSYHQNDEQAKRAFAYDLNSQDMSLLNVNPEDFNLQKVGTFDTETGEVEKLTISILCDAGPLLRKER